MSLRDNNNKNNINKNCLLEYEFIFWKICDLYKVRLFVGMDRLLVKYIFYKYGY